jgi:hypothetical protein
LPGEGRICARAGGCGGAERLRVACDVERAWALEEAFKFSWRVRLRVFRV